MEFARKVLQNKKNIFPVVAASKTCFPVGFPLKKMAPSKRQPHSPPVQQPPSHSRASFTSSSCSTLISQRLTARCSRLAPEYLPVAWDGLSRRPSHGGCGGGGGSGGRRGERGRGGREGRGRGGEGTTKHCIEPLIRPD